MEASHALRARPRAVLASAVVVALVLAVWPSFAQATHVRCGQVITVSRTLDSDLVNCPGDGVIIGAHGITLNLNGRMIDGVGLGVGVRNNGFDDVRIVNTSTAAARVQEFDYGIRLNAGTLRNLVERITVQVNEFAGIELNNADSNTVRTNTVRNQAQDGIRLTTGSSGNVVFNNTVAGNQGDGVDLVGATSNRLETNRVTGSGDRGVNLGAASNSNTLLTNTVNTNSDGAMFLTSSNGNRLERNTLDANGDAGLILSSAANNTLLTNSVRNSSDAAIFLQASNGNTLTDNDVRLNPTGISLDTSHGNRVQSNDATSSTGIGIELLDSFNNDLVLNIATSNLAQGILVSGITTVANGVLLDRNTANANKADGILVSGSGHRIQGNVARNNDGWGIYAAPGNVDGGGNRASGNAEPAQCFNVRCTA
jgi:parallel beta-helix repeat protein